MSTENTGRFKFWAFGCWGLAALTAVLAFISVVPFFDALFFPDCPEYTETESRFIHALALNQSQGRREWPGNLVLTADSVEERSWCGIGGFPTIETTCRLRLSGTVSMTVSMSLEKSLFERDSLLLKVQLHPEEAERTLVRIGEEEADSSLFDRFFHGGALELTMRSETEGPLSLYLTADSGIVAVESGDRFWGDSAVRNHAFLTIGSVRN